MQQLFGECHRELPSVQEIKKKKRRKKKVWRCKSSCLAFFAVYPDSKTIDFSSSAISAVRKKHLILKCLPPASAALEKDLLWCIHGNISFRFEKNQMQTRYLKHLGLRNETHLV